MAVATYSSTGNKATTAAKLNKTIFEVELKNHDLLKQAYVSYLANGRENLAKTLRRGEVRGGGKKPWKQKGTGRARFGSIRVPIWRGGGITFGPLGVENYSRKMTTGAKRQAIRQALSLKQAAGNVAIMEDFIIKDGKTSSASKLLQKVGATRRTLLVVDDKSSELVRATSNLADVKLVHAMYLNVANIIDADTVIITSKALEIIHEWLGVSKVKSQKSKETAK